MEAMATRGELHMVKCVDILWQWDTDRIYKCCLLWFSYCGAVCFVPGRGVVVGHYPQFVVTKCLRACFELLNWLPCSACGVWKMVAGNEFSTVISPWTCFLWPRFVWQVHWAHLHVMNSWKTDLTMLNTFRILLWWGEATTVSVC